MVDDIFAKRLAELRESKNISQRELAEVLGITRQSISLYEKAERNINIELLTKIAKYFNVSTDYLLGISDVLCVDEDAGEAVCKIGDEFVINLKKALCEAMDSVFGKNKFVSLNIMEKRLKEYVKRGKWIGFDVHEKDDKYICVYECSLCGKMVATPLGSAYDYCPNCGAKMEVGDGED